MRYAAGKLSERLGAAQDEGFLGISVELCWKVLFQFRFRFLKNRSSGSGSSFGFNCSYPWATCSLCHLFLVKEFPCFDWLISANLG